MVKGKITVTPEDFGPEVMKLLEEYSADIAEEVNAAALQTAKDTAKTLKTTSPVRSDGYNRKYPPGSYAKSWGYEKTQSTRFGSEAYTVRNKDHYQLTHLLEHGHIDSKTGRRVGTRPHIAEAEQEAIREFTEKVERGVSNV